MTRAIASGTLHKAAEERTSKAGNPFATFTLREKVNGSTRWWSVVAFDDASIAAVLSMKVGEPIAVSGEFSAELWTPEGGGEPRLSWKITADAVLSAKAKPKQRTGREVAEALWAAP
jgi:single-stranded DNA-binding protein